MEKIYVNFKSIKNNAYMNIGIYNYHLGNKQEKILENINEKYDDFSNPIKLIIKYIREKGININICNYTNINNFDLILFIEYPGITSFHKIKIFKEAIKKNKRMFLILIECEVIKPSNFIFKNHKYFEKVFTWNDKIIDNKKYIKYLYPQILNNKVNKNILFENKKLCTMINGYKLINHPLELYLERINCIKFFEKNHINDFDLYGIGWDSYTSKNKYFNIFLQILGKKIKDIITYYNKPNFRSYKGKINKKIDILKKYRFAICYENAKGIEGYITEKIFDCFLAGTIPIYLGAPNIDIFIPNNTYINKNNFKNYEELYEYISTMDEINYQKYIKNINIFLKSNEIKKFDFKSLANIIISKL